MDVVCSFDGFFFLSVAGHPVDCHCQGGGRRFISGAEYNDATTTGSGGGGGSLADDDASAWDEVGRQKGPVPYGSDQLAGPTASHMPSPSSGRSWTTRTPHRTGVDDIGLEDDAAEDEDDLADDDLGFHADFDASQPAARDLSESQIQALIAAQVARLNARLTELDEELAAEEDEAEYEAERQEEQIYKQSQQQIRERDEPAQHKPSAEPLPSSAQKKKKAKSKT